MANDTRRCFLTALPAALLGCGSILFSAGVRATTPVLSNEVEVNSASQAMLESLPHVGPALAERLIKARPFYSWDDLRLRVKGVGPSTATKLSAAGLRVQGLPYVSDATQSR
jgi:competence protein ComEA